MKQKLTEKSEKGSEISGSVTESNLFKEENLINFMNKNGLLLLGILILLSTSMFIAPLQKTQYFCKN